MRKGLGCLLLLAILLALAGGAWALHDWGGPGPAPANTTVIVPEGTSLNATATRLERAGVIRSADRFRIYARILGGGRPIKAGEYRVPARLSMSDMLKMLQGGQTLQRFVTIPEGMPSVMVRDVLMRAPYLQGQVAVPEEGSVLPDSYSYTRGDTRQSVLDRMQKAMRDYLAAAWTRRSPRTAVQSPRDALILASIVEKETGKPSERRMVAAVYSNRLRIGMPLQADPTVIYPVTQGRPLGRRILRSELQAQNGYNTYAMVGLPQGPIANPGRASIDAVLNPAQSGALYFVADGTGGHVFADTLEEHNRNVERWFAIRRARGEM